MTLEGRRRRSVRRPAAHRVSRLPALATALVACAAVTLAFQASMRVGITVDERALEVHAGATVDDLIRARMTAGRPGDLLAVDRRTVLREGAGSRPTVRIDGKPARLDARLSGGESVSTTSGADIVEPTVSQRQTIPIPVGITGSGPLVRLASTGSAGLAVLEVGAVSGKVLSTETVQPPVPMSIVRSHPVVSNRKVVALTFDDGPWPRTTNAILDVLREKKVRATFFMLGNCVNERPGIARRVVREGHVVGNHTLNHRGLDSGRKMTVRNQVRKGAATIERATGVKPRWFRPPGGHLDSLVIAETRRANERIVMWSVDPQDWRRPGWKKIASRVTRTVKPGDVILLHDGGGDRRQTVKAVERIITFLQRRGYRFVTLDELAEEKRPVRR